MIIFIIVVCSTIIISAFCSLFEAVLYSTRIPTLEAAKKEKKLAKKAIKILAMKKDIARPIAAILILNTVANTAGATLAGMYASDIFGSSSVIIFSIIFTILILFVSEIIPKTLGANFWRSLWFIIVMPLQFIQFILAPSIFLTQKITKKLTGKQKTATVTEDEILALISLGAKEGEISNRESALVKNIINLEDITVNAIMTPRNAMYVLESSLTIAQATRSIKNKGFSRIPIFEKDKDYITGYILVHDLYMTNRKKNTTIHDLSREITSVNDTVNCLSLLMSFIKNKYHIALVRDKYSSITGLVTLEDLFETIMGAEIVDETDIYIDLQKKTKKE